MEGKFNMNNMFSNAPTVGSHDYKGTNDELQAKLQQLEQQLSETQELLKCKKDKKEKKSNKKRMKKIKKFFKNYVKPLLDFLPKFLNGLANYKKAKAKFAL